MQHFEDKWTATDGTLLYAQRWMPELPLKGAVGLVHGMGEHSGRYHHLAEFFTEAGYAVVTFDHRGHGRSEGKKGHTPSYGQLMDDIALLLRQTRMYCGEHPVFLYGHSMGGNLAVNFGLRKKPVLQGIIASSPWLRLAFEPPAWQLWLARLMMYLKPDYTRETDLEVQKLSHNKNVQRAFEEDEHTHNFITASMFFKTQQAGAYAMEHTSELLLPMLVFHGTEDRITSFEASEEFARKAGKKVTFKPWQGCYHEVHNEEEHMKLFQHVLNWMDTRVSEMADRGLPGV